MFLLYHSSRAALGRLTPPRLLELARAAVREARIGMSKLIIALRFARLRAKREEGEGSETGR